jgi:hypothetical protein
LKLVETDLASAKAERTKQIAPAPACSAEEATSVSPEVIETGFSVTGRADHAVTATVTKRDCPYQIAPVAASDAEKNRKFLESVLAWPDANGPGWINLHVNRKNDTGKNDGTPWVLGWPYKDISEFIRRSLWIDNTEDMFNVWMCMSQQSECGKNTNGKPKAIRLAKNATWLKSIWIDCDVKEKPADHPVGEPWDHYETLEEARSALDAFAAKVGLPASSAVVNSGGGLHVYWISHQPLSPDQWRPYAEGLKALLLQEAIKCDIAVTTDIARLLRVPGTLNHKYSPPRAVTLVHLGQVYNFTSELSVLCGIAPAKSPAASRSAPLLHLIEPGQEDNFARGPDPAFAALSLTDTLGAGISRSSEPLDPGPVFEKCGFMRQARDTGGADYDNTLWMYSVLCATFLENGNDIAHTISRGHRKYTEAETQAMYERKLADRAERGIGWPNCATIHGAGCKACVACPIRAEGKTPLHLTGPITATVNSSPATPLPWSAPALRVTFSNIRHRRTLYGHDLVRGEVTVLGSPGGVGKSSLAIGMAVSIGVGKQLLDEKIHGSNLKVLLINAEDSSEEIQRRVYAFCIAHRVGEHELDRLYIAGADDPRVQRLSLLRTNEKGHSQQDAAGLAELGAALQSLSPDVVILDPLVALCANGNMNDNPSMSLVMRSLKALAIQFDCAILVVHHTRKNGEPGAQETISGAASIVNLARRAIMPVTLSKDDATNMGVLLSERLRYFKLVDAKSNLVVRSDDPTLYRLHSVELPNAEPPIYPFGDNVQAVARVQLAPQASAAASVDDQKIRQAILDLVARGKVIEGKVYPYSPNTTGAANVRSILDDAVAAARGATAPRQWAPGDLEAVVATTIKKLLKDGTLVPGEIMGTGRFRRGQALQVNPSLTTNGGPDATGTKTAA